MNASGKAGRELLWLSAAVCITIAVSFFITKFFSRAIDIPATGEKCAEISVSWEKQFSKSMFGYIRNDSRVVTSAEVREGIGEIKSRLLEHVRDMPYEVDIVVIHSQITNAFAFPGGLIVIFSPLIRATDSPGELAAVIAHELGHVVNRDPVKRMVRQFGISTVLSMLGGRGESTVFFENIINDFINARYNREQEDAADAFALALLDSSGIHPAHFCSFMEKLDIHRKDGLYNIEKHFMSHPDTPSRIRKAREYADSFTGTERPLTVDWQELKRRLPSIFE